MLQNYCQNMMKKNLLKTLTCLSFLFISHHAYSYTLEQYLEKLKLENVETIDDAISLLPTSVRENFSLIHSGHGLRGTSHLEPAIIGWMPDGSFFVNVGSENQNLGDQIEILQFNKSSKEIELYALEFPLKRDDLGNILKPQKNPTKCLSCHGTNPNALWGAYEKWDGFYGNGILDKVSASELKYLTDFKKEVVHTSPYKYFSFDNKNPFSPFPHEKSNPFDLSTRPNSHGGFIIARINTLKFGEQIQKSPFYNKHKFSLINALLCRKYGETTEVRNRLLRELGLSVLDIEQLKWDGISKGDHLVAAYLISNLSDSYKEKRIKTIFKSTTLEQKMKSNYYFKQDPSLELYMEPYRILDSMVHIPHYDNKKLCRYLD